MTRLYRIIASMLLQLASLAVLLSTLESSNAMPAMLVALGACMLVPGAPPTRGGGGRG